MKPIGYFRSELKKKYEVPRQGNYSQTDKLAFVEIENGFDFEQSTGDLKGFSHLWLIYLFHQAHHFKPMVLPPTSDQKRGLFATRSPHRPNPIGLSVVELVQIEGRRLWVKNFDLIDGTPILDLKPYVPVYDSIPDAALGWTSEPTIQYGVKLSALAEEQIPYAQPGLRQTLELQLVHQPFDSHRRRFMRVDPDEKFDKDLRDGLKENLKETLTGTYLYSIGTWRVTCYLQADQNWLIQEIHSGYSDLELTNLSKGLSIDKYGDSKLHLQFVERFQKYLG